MTQAAESRPLAHIRVLECASGIAGPYCGKLFVDAGADVVKVETRSGDPLRRWHTAQTPTEGDGALFHFLNGGKRSVVAHAGDRELSELVTGCDLLIADGTAGPDVSRASAIASDHPQLVVLSITPFGLHGPYAEADRPATEFVLQALCGSLGGRGLPDGRPLQAGGRIGEWTTGAYGATAALAALHGRRGELIDLSMFECMVATMGGLAAVGVSVHGSSSAPGRTVELPSIEPTADGLVGFCTITAQQFQDFLVMIGRPDAVADAELTKAAVRLRRREEFEAMVREWTTRLPTNEIVELAAAMRVPVAPVGTPNRVMEFDHFRDRGTFVANPAGFRQPRPPYRIGNFCGRSPEPAPRHGADTARVDWPPREPDPARRACLPLTGLRVLDFTAFWAGPSATLLLAALGAEVIKVEGLRRPDGMRFSNARPATDENWWESGAIFLACNAGKAGITLELSDSEARELALRLVAQCDLVIENFSPRVLPSLGLDAETIQRANPATILVRMPAFGLTGPWRDRVGFAQTMEQASGMAWLTGEADGPPLVPRGPCDPIAGLHAAFATLVALQRRRATGRGDVVEATMVEAALNGAAEASIEFSAYGACLSRNGNRSPAAVPQGAYRCAGADSWLALSVVDDDGWQRVCGVVDRPDLADDAQLRDAAGRRAQEDRIDEAIAAWARDQNVDTAVARLLAAGLAAARVNGAVDVLADPQLAARGFFEEVRHPIVASHRVMGLPFRFGSKDEPWLDRAAPTLGEHNYDVLHRILGLSAVDLERLAAAGVIGYRPAGL